MYWVDSPLVVTETFYSLLGVSRRPVYHRYACLPRPLSTPFWEFHSLSDESNRTLAYIFLLPFGSFLETHERGYPQYLPSPTFYSLLGVSLVVMPRKAAQQMVKQLSTPFWEFRSTGLGTYTTYLCSLKLSTPFWEFHDDVLIGCFKVVVERLSTPFWEFLLKQKHFFQKHTISLSTPFWEFREGVCWAQRPKPLDCCFLLPFGSFESSRS